MIAALLSKIGAKLIMAVGAVIAVGLILLRIYNKGYAAGGVAVEQKNREINAKIRKKQDEIRAVDPNSDIDDILAGM